MGMVRVTMSEKLHTRVKTFAAYHDKKIKDYIVDVLEKSVPREIKFEDETTIKKTPKAVS
jgi:hypothetical protein